jgi:hypothetical protein
MRLVFSQNAQKEHRIVYKVEVDSVLIAQVRYNVIIDNVPQFLEHTGLRLLPGGSCREKADIFFARAEATGSTPVLPAKKNVK